MPKILKLNYKLQNQLGNPIAKKVVSQLKMRKRGNIYKEIDQNIWIDYPQPIYNTDWPECRCQNRQFCCKTQKCELFPFDIECHLEAHGGIDCGNQKLQRKQFAKTEVRNAGAKGKGLFALQPMKANTLIGEYVGEVINVESVQQRISKNSFYAIKLSSQKYIDASMYGNKMRFLNHSCSPNCECRYIYLGDEKKIALFTTKFVKKDEELTFDYDLEDWGNEKVQCFCGSPNCTGSMQKIK